MLLPLGRPPRDPLQRPFPGLPQKSLPQRFGGLDRFIVPRPHATAVVAKRYTDRPLPRRPLPAPSALLKKLYTAPDVHKQVPRGFSQLRCLGLPTRRIIFALRPAEGRLGDLDGREFGCGAGGMRLFWVFQSEGKLEALSFGLAHHPTNIIITQTHTLPQAVEIGEWGILENFKCAFGERI